MREVMVVSKPAIERVVETFRAAANANRNTCSRAGNIVEISPAEADDVLISADLHGCRRNFDKLLSIAELDAHPRRQLIMQEVCHGGPTYPGGGCMSHTLLEDVAQLKVDYGDRFHFILANHELSELTDFPIMKSGRMLNLLFRCGLQEIYGDNLDRVREAYQEFIRSCPLAVRLSGGAFVSHSAPAGVDRSVYDDTVFGRELRQADLEGPGPVFQLVWGRDFRQENARRFAEMVGARVLIHGHEPCESGFDRPNDFQLILDSQGDRGSYLLIAPDDGRTPQELVGAIRRINE